MKTRTILFFPLCILSAAFYFSALPRPVRACELAIIWRADMANQAKTSRAAAAIQFDFAHPGAIVQVDTKNLRDVRTVQLHVARSYSDHTGPVVLQVYAASGGQMPPAFTRRVTEADLHRQTNPRITAFSDLVQAVLDHRAYVTVTTQRHSEGELSGFITMHKEAIYSDNPSDISHNAALHHAASLLTQ